MSYNISLIQINPILSPFPSIKSYHLLEYSLSLSPHTFSSSPYLPPPLSIFLPFSLPLPPLSPIFLFPLAPPLLTSLFSLHLPPASSPPPPPLPARSPPAPCPTSLILQYTCKAEKGLLPSLHRSYHWYSRCRAPSPSQTEACSAPSLSQASGVFAAAGVTGAQATAASD